MQRNASILLITTLIALVFQVYIWRNTTLFDPDFWTSRAEYLAYDLTHMPVRFNPLRHAGHPAMPPLLMASVLIRGGVDAESALRISSIILGTSIIVASSIFLITYFKQHRQWAIFIIGTLITNRLLANSNVADAFLMSIILLFFLALYAIWTQERPHKATLLIIAISAGLAFATRIHNALPLIIPAFCILPIRLGFKKTALLVCGALGCWYIFTPVIWFSPFEYIRYALIGEPVYVMYTSATLPPSTLVQVSLWDVARRSPLMIGGILLAMLWLYSNRVHPYISKWYLALLLVSTAALLAILQISHIESLRYYYPLMIVWESFAFLLALPLMESFEKRYSLQKYRLTTLYIVFSIAGNALLLMTSL